MQVVHHPRLAWDTARLFVAAADDAELFAWLAHQVGEILGPAHEQELRDTGARVSYPAEDRSPVEAGIWRVRLEDLLRARPEVVEPLRSLTVTASGLLRDRQRLAS
ncbi:hypothetical protein [Micromonospora coxensis]|uniref:Uncharacterized protein n=1 Tax=Micromonospora coxensis TaxID=356852 RepID=A0A1C5JDV6_9ACTN|nr:hypothetical protein [Micromonospora coxensis]SCG68678.1 hypothetical protein GA0070614_4426 [Micromonospora coxensis]